jgi:RHS repeat-associated protein
VRTNYAGSTAALYASFAYGDTSYAFNILNPNSGYNQDNAFYAGLDYDSGSGTDHAMFRQYTPSQGRWMSPDPYSGSYDPSNPQSYNRYSYALNNPAGMTDPSGLFTNGAYCGDSCSGGGGDGAFINLFIDLGEAIAGLFGRGPSFHGTLSPRPSTGNSGWDGNFGESLGIPTSIPRGNFGLGMALGLPSQGCEFGACGSSFGPGMEDHHIFPQAFRDWFAQHGIEIDEYTIALERAVHRLKPNGLHTTSGGDWNGAWRRWIADHPNATPQEILNQGKKFVIEFGVGAGDVFSDFFIMVSPCVADPAQPMCQTSLNLTMPVDMVTPQHVTAKGM